MKSSEIIYGNPYQDQPLSLKVDQNVKESEATTVIKVQNEIDTKQTASINSITIEKEGDNYNLLVDGTKKGATIVATGGTGPGAQGPQGPAGEQGAQGPQGATGEKGEQGAQGPQGAAGEKGEQGAEGPQGAAGEKGEQGAQGPQGAAGKDGVSEETVQSKINATIETLDVETIGGESTYISSIAEQNGKITATTQDINKFVFKKMTGGNGTAEIFNESDGGGAHFIHNDGTEAFVGVNDGGESGMMAQIYADKKINGNWVGSRINAFHDGIYYVSKSEQLSGVTKDDAGHEIAIKKDITTLESAIANKTTKSQVGANGIAEMFNESDGGGAHFIHNDGTEAFVGVNDGGKNGLMAQIYADEKVDGKWVGSRINAYNKGIFYVSKEEQIKGIIKDDANHEIAVKKDTTPIALLAEAGLHFEVVDALPTNPDANTIYLVKKS